MQHLEAPLAWAVWALDRGILAAAELAPHAAPTSGATAGTREHAVHALLRFFEAVQVGTEAGGGGGKAYDGGCVAPPGAEQAIRHLTLAAVDFLRRVRTA